MVLPVSQFPILTPDQAQSPLSAFFKGYQTTEQASADIQSKRLANQIAAVNAKYAEPQAQSQLAQQQAQTGLTQQQAQYYGPQAQAQMALQRAQGGAAYAQANAANANAAQTRSLMPFMKQQEQYKAELMKLQAENPGLTNSGPAGIIALGQLAQQRANANVQQQQSVAPSQGQMSQQGGLPGLGGGMPQQNPAMGGGTSPSSQPMGAQQLGQSLMQANGKSNSVLDMYTQMAMAPIQEKVARTQLEVGRANALPWTQLPQDAKRYTLAQATAFGYDPDQANQLLAKGQTLQQLGDAKGYTNPNERPQPIYSPTSKDIQTARNNSAIYSEMQPMQSFITDSLAPYAQKIPGDYSPVQISQAIKGDDPEAQAKFWAAHALAPDLTSMRIRLLNGEAGVTLMQELQDKAMLNNQSSQAFMTPQIFKRANQLIEQQLGGAINAASKVRTNQGTGAPNRSPASGANTNELINFVRNRGQ